ncbi:hypothetical protein SK128_000546, partial [Halocaridina rubra]
IAEMTSKMPKIKNCELVRNLRDFSYYGPKWHIHVHDEKNNIKIYHVGQPNDLQTKVILLIGETGAGKTRLLNSLYNHICSVNFHDSYRLEVIDEVGSELKKDYDSQTDCITGYLFHFEPGMRYKYNILIIDTPGFGDTRGANKQAEIVRQMEVFLKEEKFGIIDLHCLSFVVKASMNRRMEYFGVILKQCMSLFGKNTTTITQVMTTHAADKMKNVNELLKSWGLSSESVFNFDNGTLYEPNTPDTIGAEGDVMDEAEISIHKYRWNKRTKECDAFFQLLFSVPSVSLRLTREALREKSFLEHSKVNLIKQIEAAFNCILANNNNLHTIREYDLSMRENRAWSGTEDVLQKTRVPIKEECIFFIKLISPHVHNCAKCEKSCSDICHWFVACPDVNAECKVCGCSGKNHIRDDEIIKESWVTIEVTDTEMKEKFDNASDKKRSLEEHVRDLQAQEEKHRRNIAKMIALIQLQTERLSEISTMPVYQSSEEFLVEIMQDLLKKNPRFNRKLEENFMTVFTDSILKEANTVCIDKATWKKELDKLLKESDSVWNKTKKAAFSTFSQAPSLLV